MTRRLAAIDLGSNSVKLACALGREVVIDRETITRIGEGLERTGRLDPVAIERTMRALAADVLEARAFGAEEIRCVATAGLRGAANALDLVARAKDELGLDIEVIDGDREAELAFAAVISRNGGPLTIVDIGGRSTEIVTGDAVVGIMQRVSLDLGGVRMTERHLFGPIPSQEELDAMTADIDRVLTLAPDRVGEIFGVSGTVLAMMSFELGLDDMKETARRGDGMHLKQKTVLRAYDQLKAVPLEQRIRGTAIPPLRADVIVAGAAIVLGVMRRYELDAIRVSSRELRHALLDVVDVERDDREAGLDEDVVDGSLG